MENKLWWKLLCVPILLYVIIVGLSVPLSQGITSMSQYTAYTGQTFTVSVATYNTFHTKAKEVKARLRKDTSLFIAAQNVKVIDDKDRKSVV